MSNLQKKVNTVWYALFSIDELGYCNEDADDNPRCYLCPEPEKAQSTCGKERAAFLENWLRNNGFPAREPRIYTISELTSQLTKGRSLPCMAQWIAQVVEAVICPDCGKHTLFRERRMTCTGCGSVYPADRWAAGEPCGCGSLNAKYAGKYTSSQFGHMEFQQCNTDACRWNDNYRPLTMQDLANEAARAAGDEYDQRHARTEKKL